MKERSPLAIFLLPFITFGIYLLYWLVVTKTEMNRNGADIPTAWLLVIPLVNIWWYWKFAEGVEEVTHREMSAGVAFLMLFLLPIIGPAIIQTTLNKIVR